MFLPFTRPFTTQSFGIWFLSVLLCLAPRAAFAAEVDSFTDRRPLADSLPVLDAVVNNWLDEAAQSASARPLFLAAKEGCDVEALYDAVDSTLGGFLVGRLEQWVNESPHLDVIRVPYEQSVYQDFPVLDSPTLALSGRLAVLLRMGDVYIGSDKFGHFFSEGYTYFKLYRRAGADASFDFGELTEATVFGQTTTGIYSFADLSANLNGLRFWNRLLGEWRDPITGSPVTEPYIQCVAGRWVRVRDFTWRDYLDETWDEGLNCNVVKDAALYRKLIERVRQATGGRTCPLRTTDRTALAQKYGSYLPYIFNPDGIRAEKVEVRQRFNAWMAHLWQIASVE